MSSSEYSIKRNGDLFTVGNDQVGYKTFRLKISGGSHSEALDSEKLEQIAEIVFDVLKSSNVPYKSLAKTKVTAKGIQTDQLNSGKVSLIDKEKLPAFGDQFEAIGRVMRDTLARSYTRSERLQPPLRPIEVKVNETSPEVAKQAMKTSGAQIKKSFWPEFIMKIYEFFEKRIVPKWFKARHTEYANHLVSQSPKKIQALKDFRLEDVKSNPELLKYGALGSKFAYVPEEIMLSEGERDAKLRSKKIGAIMAIEDEHQMYKTVLPLSSGGVKVTGYKVNSNKEGAPTIRPNRVIPTAFRHADHKKDKRDRLPNIYMTAKDGKGLIRTGVIDSEEKVKEFVLAARELNKQMGSSAPSNDRPLRIVSHQLNSPEHEGAMIQGQHLNMAIQDHEVEDIELVHLNTPCNRFYNVTKSLEKKGLHFLKGEEKSRVQNIEGMARYLVWLVEDMERMSKDPKLSEKQRHALALAAGKLQLGSSGNINKLKAQIEQINETHAKLHEKKVELKKKESEGKNLKLSMGLATYFGEKMKHNVEIKLLNEEIEYLEDKIDSLRKGMCDMDEEKNYWKGDKGILINVYKTLKDNIEDKVLAGDDPVIREQRNTVMLYRKLLGNLYNYENIPQKELMDRGQELMMFQLLNQRMGVISGINCKSGLDRTGFVFAMMMGLMQTPEDVAMDIAGNWDRYTKDLNKKMKEFDYDTTKLYEWIDELENSELRNVYQTILDFRLNVFNNLLNVSMPITAVSTGLFGLKWGSGLSENLIPLNFIPPVVQMVHKDGSVELVKLLDYSEKGNVKGLTKMGHRLLTQMSSRRGA